MKNNVPPLDPIYAPLWDKLGAVSKKVLLYYKKHRQDESWLILELTYKFIQSLESCSVLIALEFWSDAVILGRALFETQIIIKWLLSSDTEKRSQIYLSGIDDEKKRLISKMEAGQSISALALNEVLRPLLTTSANSKQGDYSNINLREMTRIVGDERHYDINYWLASSFVHSHALSLIPYSNSLKKQENGLSQIISFDDNASPLRSFLLIGIPTIVLDLFEIIDKKFGLNIQKDIEDVREHIRECMIKTFQIEVAFSADIKPGTLQYGDKVYQIKPRNTKRN